MANVNSVFSISVVDADGRSASLPIYGNFADTLTAADIGVQARGMASLVDSITAVKPTTITVSLEFDATGVKATPDVASDVEEGGLFAFNLASPVGKTYSIFVPGIDPSLVVSDVIANTGAVLAFTSAIITPASVGWTNDLWSSLLSSLKGNAGKQRFRKIGGR